MNKSRRIPKKWDKSHFLVKQVKVALVNTMQPNTPAALCRCLIDPSFWGLVTKTTTH